MGYFPPSTPGPFIVYYLLFALPLGLLGIYFAYKDGFIGTKTKNQKTMLAIFILVTIWYVGLHAYLHFVLPHIGVH